VQRSNEAVNGGEIGNECRRGSHKSHINVSFTERAIIERKRAHPLTGDVVISEREHEREGLLCYPP